MNETKFHIVDDKKLSELRGYLENGGDPNLTDGDGATLIFYAVLGLHIQALDLLIEFGADVNYYIDVDFPAHSYLAPTPLDLAQGASFLLNSNAYSPIVRHLLEAGAKNEL